MESSVNLPDHVPIKIATSDIPRFQEVLEKKGYVHTFFQIRKPKQLYGLINIRDHKGKEVEHHVRCFTNGEIFTEIELKRLKEMWLHLTSRSISAHEIVIDMLEKENISYQIDEEMRQMYADHEPQEFVRDYLEFYRWLVYGVIFWSPLGYLWTALYRISKKFRREISS